MTGLRIIPPDDIILAGINAGKNLNEIADETNTPVTLIRNHVLRRGWAYTKTGIRGPGRDINWPTDDEIVGMLEAGMTTVEIGARIGCGRDSVSRRIRNRGLRERVRSKQAVETTPPAILTDDERRIVVFRRYWTLEGHEKLFRISLPRVSILAGWEGVRL